MEEYENLIQVFDKEFDDKGKNQIKKLLLIFFYETELISLDKKVELVFKYPLTFIDTKLPECLTFCAKAVKSNFMKDYDARCCAGIRTYNKPEKHYINIPLKLLHDEKFLTALKTEHPKGNIVKEIMKEEYYYEHSIHNQIPSSNYFFIEGTKEQVAVPIITFITYFIKTQYPKLVGYLN